jgi:hypothetical protein
MKLDINPRGNGACPLCAANGSCRIQRLLTDGIARMGEDFEMEIVVYTCPHFVERQGA